SAGMNGELLVVAVEASADLHGAAVLRELRTLRPGLRAFGAGGPLLRAEGCETLVRAEDLSVMGIAEVLPAIPRIFRALRTLRRALGLAARCPVLALLPGSRRQEIRRIWPALLGAARLLLERMPDLQLVVAVAPTVRPEWLRADLPVAFVAGRAPEVLAAADAAVVASGTATLEAALAQVPTVVVYRLSWLSWIVGRLLVRVPLVSLANLLAGTGLVPGLLHRACT